MISRQQVYEAIDSERNYQDKIWAENNPINPLHPTDPRPLAIGEEILLLEEYVLKARFVWSKESRPEIGALDDMRKIAAIAVRSMETWGAPKREMSEQNAAPDALPEEYTRVFNPTTGQYAVVWNPGVPAVTALRAECERLRAQLTAAQKDAERFVFLQNIDPKEAQAFFWNISSRRERAKAIDAAREKK